MNRLALELIADANPLLKTLDATQRNLDRFVSASDAAGKSLGGGVNRALEAFEGLAKGGAGAVGVLAGGLAALTVGTLSVVASAGRHAEMLDQLSQKTGIAMSAIQSSTILMAESGLTTDGLTAATKKLSQHIVDSHNPAARSATLFQELGITAQTVEGVLGQLADLFTRMPDGAGKTALAVELLGKSGQDLIPVLNKGSEGLRESAARSRELGAILSDEAVKALGKADDAFDQLGVASAAVGHQLGALLAPSVTSVVTTMATGVGTVASFFGALQGGAHNVETALPVMEKVSALLQKMGGPGFDTTSIQKSIDAQNAFGAAAKLAHEEFIAAEKASGQAQEDLGERIVHTTQLQIASAHVASLAFADRLALQDKVNALQFEKPSASGTTAFDAQVKAANALIDLMPQLTFHEANLLALHNQDHAAQTILEAATAYQHRNDALDDAVAKTKVLDEAQSALYRSEAGLFGASDAARRVRFSLIDAEAERKRQVIEEEIFNETRKAEALQNLETETDTKRRWAIQQFPSFFEQQMQALVNSNSFSMGQMVSTWSGGIAQMVVHGGNLKAAWEQTQVALVQAALNSGVQMLAQAALNASLEIGLRTATEASKTAAQAAGSVARIAIAEEEAVTTESVYTGMAKSAFGAIAAVQSATVSFMMGAWAVLMKIGTFVVGLLSTIAAALEATIFGIPVGLVIGAAAIGLAAYLASQGEVMAAVGVGLAGVAAGAAGLGLFGGGAGGEVFPEVSTVGFAADGLIATGPTPRIFGEAGPEAAIPLNSRGAAVMSDMLGMGGGGGEQRIYVMLDGRQIGEAVAQRMMDRVYVEVGA